MNAKIEDYTVEMLEKWLKERYGRQLLNSPGNYRMSGSVTVDRTVRLMLFELYNHKKYDLKD